MSMSVLIVGAEKSPYLTELEERIFSCGYKTLFVVGSFEALNKCSEELFNVIIFELKCIDLDKINFFEKIKRLPFAAITPLLVIRDSHDSREVNQLSSVLDQVFSSDTSPELLAKHVKENIELRSKKIKKGMISEVAVPSVLYAAHYFKFKGAAIFEKGDSKKIIYFDEGKIIFASSNIPSERFGEYMVSQGLISRTHLNQALEVSQKSNLRFGQILVELGHIQSDTLVPLLQNQIKHILFSVFDWKEGDFFLLFDQSAGAEDIPARFQAPLLIAEGIKRKFDTSRLIFELSPLTQTISLDAKWKNAVSEFPVTRMEFRLIDQMEEGLTIEDLVKTATLSELETLRLIYLLKSIGLLRLKGDDKVIEGKTVKIEDELSVQSFLEEVSTKQKMPEPKVKERQSFASDAYQTNIVELKGRKVRKIGSFWKGFATAVIIFGLVITGLYLYVNDKLPVEKFIEKLGIRVGGKDRVEVVQTPDSVSKPFPKVTPTPAPTVKFTPKPKPTAAKVKVVKTPVKTRIVPTSDPRKLAYAEYFYRARKYFKAEELEKSISEFEKAYKIKRDDDLMLVEMGQCYFELGRSIEAIEKYKEALKINPQNPLAYLHLGSAYQFHGKNSLAIAQYRSYLRLDPQGKNVGEVIKVLNDLEKGK